MELAALLVPPASAISFDLDSDERFLTPKPSGDRAMPFELPADFEFILPVASDAAAAAPAPPCLTPLLAASPSSADRDMAERSRPAFPETQDTELRDPEASSMPAPALPFEMPPDALPFLNESPISSSGGGGSAGERSGDATDN